jgi:hypothetical protein
LERHQRELFSPGQLQWLLPTTRFTRKKHAKKTRPATEIKREKEKKLQAEKEARVAKKLESFTQGYFSH